MGIWHETYVVPAGSYESIYIDIPPAGLGEAWGVEPVSRRGERAAQRLESGAGRRR
ncbi:monooxygenase family protein [Streptomyces olivaceus]